MNRGPNVKEYTKNVITTKPFNPLNVIKEENMLTPRSPTKLISKVTNTVSKSVPFELSPSHRQNKENKEPSLMSLAERKALFEKNGGEALVPKAALGMAVPPATKLANVTNISAQKKVHCVPEPNMVSNFKKTFRNEYDAKNVEDTSCKPTKIETGGIASKIAALAKYKETISQKQIESSTKEQRQKEMDVLFNRFNKNKQVCVFIYLNSFIFIFSYSIFKKKFYLLLQQHRINN